MLRNHSCSRCGDSYVTANPTSVCCNHCVLTQLVELDLKSPPPPIPAEGLSDDVKLLAREIYTRAIISELHRSHAGDNLLNLVSHASIQAAKSYFEVENNV